MSSHTVRETFNGAFVISMETVGHLARGLEKLTGSPARISVSFKGGQLSLAEDSVDGLGEDVLFRSHEIEDLTLRSYAKGGGAQGQVYLSAGILASNLTLSGSREAVASAHLELSNEMKGSRSRYSFLFGLHDIPVFVFSALVGTILTFAVPYPVSWGVWTGIVSYVLVLGVVLAVRRLCFRKMEFLFGMGETRASERRGLRKTVFGTILGAVVIGIVVNAAWDWTKTRLSSNAPINAVEPTPDTAENENGSGN